MTEEQKAFVVDVLTRFAKMDRDGCDLSELACQRGVASDMTILTSQDFRDARRALEMIAPEVVVVLDTFDVF